jgi:hypothetical protein
MRISLRHKKSVMKRKQGLKQCGAGSTTIKATRINPYTSYREEITWSIIRRSGK